MTDSDSILDLSELTPDRQPIKFTRDGPTYYMLAPTEMPVRQRTKFVRLYSEIEKLQNKDTLSDDGADKLSKAIDDAARMVLVDISDEEFAEIPDMHKEVTCLTFMNAYGQTLNTMVRVGSGGTEETTEDSGDEQTGES